MIGVIYMGFRDDYKKVVEQKRKIAVEEAVARATYRVQEDFNNEFVEELASKTGHPNLAITCFVDVTPNGESGLHYHFYNDASMIDGLFSSNSSFHKSGGKWTVVSEHYGMSAEEFWERKAMGEDGGSFGVVDADWLADNFWDGVYWATNGWPRSGDEFLMSYKYNDVSAISVIKDYVQRYKKSNRFQKYINEELHG